MKRYLKVLKDINLLKIFVKVFGWLKKLIYDKEVLLIFWYFKGKLIGYFYDKNGNLIKVMNNFERFLE